MGYAISRFEISINPILSICMFAAIWFLMWGLDIINELYTPYEVNYFSYMFRLPMFLAGVFLCMAFKEFHIKQNRFINFLGANSLGAYLLHDGLFFRNWFWDWLDTEKYYHSLFFAVHMIIWCVVLFFAGVFVEGVRKEFHNRTVKRTKAYKRIAALFDNNKM